MIARRAGHVVRALGATLVAVVPGVGVGDGVRVEASHGVTVDGEITAVERERVWISPHGPSEGIAVGDRVVSDGVGADIACGAALLGRALDAAGTPLDGGEPFRRSAFARVRRSAPAPSERLAIDTIFWTGVRALDGLLPMGRGARVGLFGAPGTGKSSLLEAIVAGARADAVVLALVGERGREAQRWIDRLDSRTTIVCATSDRSATERVRATDLAMLQACALRERGCDVLLVVDSLARYAGALRERRNGLGEPAGRGGYPPGVWSDLARYVERAGITRSGSITLVASVLSDGADDREPLSDAARSLLDGHVALSLELARAGRFPAIDVLASTSRTMGDCASPEHVRDAARVRGALAYLADSRDAREMGLATPHDPRSTAALAAEPMIESFLRSSEPSHPQKTIAGLARAARLLEPIVVAPQV
jgi:type III secretion protein N (ATPase)